MKTYRQNTVFFLPVLLYIMSIITLYSKIIKLLHDNNRCMIYTGCLIINVTIRTRACRLSQTEQNGLLEFAELLNTVCVINKKKSFTNDHTCGQ